MKLWEERLIQYGKYVVALIFGSIVVYYLYQITLNTAR